MVRMARQGAVALLHTVGQVSAGATVAAKKVRATLERIGNDPNEELTLHQAANVATIVNRLTTAMRQATQAAQTAMEMERLILGEPGTIIGHMHVDLEPVTVIEAREKLEAVRRAIGTLEAEDIAVLDDRPHDPSLQ